MALGGGNWSYDDKILPGTYVNFTNPSILGNDVLRRGAVAIPLDLNWGPEGEIIELDSETIEGNSQKLLGYNLYNEQMLFVRELFINATKVYAYRLGSGGVKAANIYAVAKYTGTRGNDIQIGIKESIDKPSFYSVKTYLDGNLVDSQEVETANELKSNDYVDFVKGASLANTNALPLIGGTDGEDVTGENYASFLTEAEKYFFDILCCPTSDTDTIDYFVAYTERMNSETGSNFQLVCYRPQNVDSENVIQLQNSALGISQSYALVYWLAGAQAACAIGSSLTGKVYDGELTIDAKYSQSELKDHLNNGKFIFHNSNGKIRVLRDINSLVSYDSTRSEDFSSNQTVRVCFAVASSIAELFNTKYLGLVANDQSGRTSLWNDVCKILETLENSQAISEFNSQDVVIKQGSEKHNVICSIKNLVVAGAMEALYMNVVIV